MNWGGPWKGSMEGGPRKGSKGRFEDWGSVFSTLPYNSFQLFQQLFATAAMRMKNTRGIMLEILSN